MTTYNPRVSSDIMYDYQRRINPSQLFSYKHNHLSIISSKFESLDYDNIENDLRITEEVVRGYKYLVRKNVVKWCVFLQIGFFTAVVASTVDIAISSMCKLKYEFIRKYMEREDVGRHVVLVLWIMLNIVPFLLGSLMITYIEPIAAGSGIPLVKCYLNGVEIPRVLRLKTLIVKAGGLACSIIGGVASGKEGPMIHVGAAIASIVSAGQIRIFDKKINLYRYFRDDPERRDLVSAGAASGVSAAFGASVGGVLFSLEEGASFWNQNLTWRIFFASVVSKFTVNLILSAYYGHAGDLEHPSLINMGTFDFKYSIYEIPAFALMGCLGGMLGALWNQINYRLSVFRIKYIRHKYLRILEAAAVSGFTAIVAFLMTYYLYECGDLRSHRTEFAVKVHCDKQGGGEYNTIGSMWLQTPQASVNSLLHDPEKTYGFLTLGSFTVAYYFLSCITFGLSSSNGIFVPSLLTGAAWGRLLCLGALANFPTWDFLDAGKYALIGAAAQLGGLVRMTISLTVILMESSDNISFSLPIIITLISAKWTGDFFNDGIYDISIKLKAVPFLFWDPPPLSHSIYATEVMHAPAICVKGIERVGFLYDLLKITTHNGFPIVDSQTMDESQRIGKIKGMILRSQIVLMCYYKMFLDTEQQWQHLATADLFRDAFLEHITFDMVELTEYEKLTHYLDLRPFMNNSPYTLLKTASLPRVFRLFRTLGLRHLPIVDESNEVVGIVTRKDLAKFRVIKHRGKLQLNQLVIVS